MRYLVVSGTQRSFQAIWRICLKMCKFGLVHSCFFYGSVTENFRFQKRKESVSKLKLFTNLIRNSAFNCKMKGKIDMISLAEASRRRIQHIVC